jgi:hypothetical protein
MGMNPRTRTLAEALETLIADGDARGARAIVDAFALPRAARLEVARLLSAKSGNGEQRLLFDGFDRARCTR